MADFMTKKVSHRSVYAKHTRMRPQVVGDLTGESVESLDERENILLTTVPESNRVDPLKIVIKDGSVVVRHGKAQSTHSFVAQSPFMSKNKKASLASKHRSVETSARKTTKGGRSSIELEPIEDTDHEEYYEENFAKAYQSQNSDPDFLDDEHDMPNEDFMRLNGVLIKKLQDQIAIFEQYIAVA
jgi:hypothetical protein